MEHSHELIKEKRVAVKERRAEYLRAHPELEHLQQVFVRAVLVRRPYNVNGFARDFFTHPQLKSVLAQCRHAEADQSPEMMETAEQALFDFILSLPSTSNPPTSVRPQGCSVFHANASSDSEYKAQAIQALFQGLGASKRKEETARHRHAVGQDSQGKLQPYMRLLMCNDAPDFAADEYKCGSVPAVAQWASNVRNGCHTFHSSHEKPKIPTLWLHAGNMFGPDLYRPLPITLIEGYEMQGSGVTACVPEISGQRGKLAVVPEKSGGVYPATRILKECSIDILLPGDKDISVSYTQITDLMQRYPQTVWVLSNLRFGVPTFSMAKSKLTEAWTTDTLLYATDFNQRGDNVDYFVGANQWADHGYYYLPLVIDNNLIFVVNMIAPEFVSTYNMVTIGATDIEDNFVICLEKHVSHFTSKMEGVDPTELYDVLTLHLTLHGGIEAAINLWTQVKESEVLMSIFGSNIIISVVDDQGEAYRLAASPVMSVGSRWNTMAITHLYPHSTGLERKDTLDPAFPASNYHCLFLPFTRTLESSGLRLAGMSDLGDAYVKSWDSLLEQFSAVDAGNSGALTMVEFIGFASALANAKSDHQFELIRGPQQMDWRKWACDLFRALDADGDAVVEFESVFLLLFNRSKVREYSQFVRDRHTHLNLPIDMQYQDFRTLMESLTSDQAVLHTLPELYKFLSRDQPNGSVSLRTFFRSHSISSMVSDDLVSHNTTFCNVRKEIRRNERWARQYYGFDVSWRKPLVCLTSALDALSKTGSRVAQFNTSKKYITSRSTPFTTMMALSQTNLTFLEELALNGNSYDVSMADTVVPLLMAGSFGHTDALDSPISVRDLCGVDPYPNNLYIARVTYEELRSFLISGLSSVFARDCLTPYTVPSFDGFPALANVGIIFNIDDPEQSILFDTNANHSNTLEGAKLCPLSTEYDLVLLTDEFCKSGGNQYTYVIPSERWSLITRTGLQKSRAFKRSDSTPPIRKRRARASTTLPGSATVTTLEQKPQPPSPGRTLKMSDSVFLESLTNTYGTTEQPPSPGTPERRRRQRSASMAVKSTTKHSKVFDIENVTTAPATGLLSEQQKEFAAWRAGEVLQLDDMPSYAIRRGNALRFLHKFGTATELVVEDFNVVSVWFVDKNGNNPVDTPLGTLYDSDVFRYHRAVQGYEYQMRKQLALFRTARAQEGLSPTPRGLIPQRDLRRIHGQVTKIYPAVLSAMGDSSPEHRNEPWEKLEVQDMDGMVPINTFLELEVQRRHALLYGRITKDQEPV